MDRLEEHLDHFVEAFFVRGRCKRWNQKGKIRFEFKKQQRKADIGGGKEPFGGELLPLSFPSFRPMFVGRRFFSGQKEGGRRRLSHSCPGRSGKSLFSNGGCDAGGREGRREREKGILKVWPLLWGRSHRYRSGAQRLLGIFSPMSTIMLRQWSALSRRKFPLGPFRRCVTTHLLGR